LFLCGTWGEKKVRAGYREFPEFNISKKRALPGAMDRCDASRRPRRGAPAAYQGRINGTSPRRAPRGALRREGLAMVWKDIQGWINEAKIS